METSLSTSGNLSKKTRNLAPMALSGQDFKLLKVFKAVVEAGGFSAAQNELNVGLAAISKQISDLEIRIGMRLCSRGREGFSLTDEGQIVYQASIELFNSVESFRDRISCAQNELIGDLNIGVIDNTLTDYNSPLIAALKTISEQAPGIRIRLAASQLDELERGVIEGRFVASIVPVYHMREEFDYFEIYKERSNLYCGQGHELFETKDSEIDTSTLDQYELVNHRYALHSVKNQFFSNNNSATSASQVEAVAILLLTGRFVGFLPSHYAANLVKDGRLRAICPNEINFDATFSLILKHGSAHTPVIKAFAEAMKINLKRDPLS